tara:strand:+ start:312 stop:2918 length:2607 start_codon:yes stop_codon:yes gene_type:complete
MSIFAIGQSPTNFIRKPAFPAKIINIESIDGSEHVVYEFSLQVNIGEARKQGLTSIFFEALPEIPVPPNPKSFIESGNPLDYRKGMESFTRALRNYQIQVSSSVFKTARHPLVPTYNRMSRVIPPPPPVPTSGKIKEFSFNEINKFADPQRKMVRTKMPFEGVGKSIVPMKDEDLVPRKNASKTKGSKSIKYNPKVPQSDGVGKPRPQSTRSTFREVLRAGVDPAKMTIQNNIRDLISQPALAATVSKAIYTPPSVAPPPQTYTFTPVFREVKVRMKILKSILDDFTSFVVRAMILNNGVASQTVTFGVSHARNMNVYLTPDVPPIMTAAYSSRGRINVSIVQKDPKATRVKVFRRTHPLSSATTLPGSSWVEVLDTDLATNQKTTFRDNFSYFGQVMYRALSYGPNGKPGEDFSSSVVRPVTKGRITTALTANASFKEQRFGSPIVIRVTDIPPSDEVSMIRLQRYDITYDSRRLKRQGKDRGFTYVESSKSAVGLTEVVFEDRNVRSGRVYEYLPVGTSPTEGTIYGSPYFIDVPVFTDEPLISLDITRPMRVPGSRDNTEVQMELNADFTDFGFNKIKETLSAKGQEQLYNDQIQKNRSEFGKLISFIVDRENLKTGDSETFGVVNPGTFIDDKPARSKVGMSEPEEGNEYMYKVTALINTADNMFPKVTGKSIDPSTLNIVTQTLSKLTSPLTKAKGVIPSTARQFDLSAVDKVFPVDPRESALTNVQKKFPYMFSPPSNRVTEVKVEQLQDCNRISWIFDGPLRSIDHFKVELICSGGDVLIDTVHCAPGTKRFFYRHKDIGYALDYQYRITPVNLSFSSVSSIKSGIIPASLLGVKQEVNLGVNTGGLPNFTFPVDMMVRKY